MRPIRGSVSQKRLLYTISMQRIDKMSSRLDGRVSHRELRRHILHNTLFQRVLGLRPRAGRRLALDGTQRFISPI